MKKKFKELRRTPPPEADISVNIDEKDKITESDDLPTLGPQLGRHVSVHKKWYQRPYSKKQKIIAIVVAAVIVLSGIGLFTYFHYFHKTTPVNVHYTAIKKPKPVVIASPLTGLPVTEAQSKLPVTGVMIENSDQARPQSGLSQAGVVFEALAEGGITRFLVLYQEGNPSSIGPVRSARPYFIDWLDPFNAAYAHVGGSPAALTEIQTLGIRDLNQFYNSGAYTRISSREAPHNVYTSMSALLSLETQKGWTTSSFTGFPRKMDAPAKTPTASSIKLNIAGSDMNVAYQYDSKTNSYLRSEGGSPMVDANNNQQLSPKVVIAMVVPWTNGPLDSSGAYYTQYSDIGTGQADIFQDGTVTTGTWSKPSQGAQIQFLDSAGKPIPLNAGQTWITAMGSSNLISYTP